MQIEIIRLESRSIESFDLPNESSAIINSFEEHIMINTIYCSLSIEPQMVVELINNRNGIKINIKRDE